MNCDQAHELFSDYITGDLEPALRVKVENHLVESEGCRSALEDVRRLWTELDLLPAVEPPPGLHNDLMARVSAELIEAPAPEPKRSVLDLRTLFRARSFALAATLLICALAGIEVVQTQRAALGPIGALVHMMHPSAVSQSALQSASAQWMPKSGAAGVLVVHLRTSPSADAHSSATTFTVTLRRKLAGIASAQEPILATAKISMGADELQSVSLNLSETPTSDTSVLEVAPSPNQGSAAQSLSVSLPTN